MRPHSVITFEIKNYYLNKPKFNDFYSRNNLPEMKYGVNLLNHHEYKLIGTHWIAL